MARNIKIKQGSLPQKNQEKNAYSIRIKNVILPKPSRNWQCFLIIILVPLQDQYFSIFLRKKTPNLSRATVPLSTYFNCVLVRGLAAAVPLSAITVRDCGARARDPKSQIFSEYAAIYVHQRKPYTRKRKSYLYISFLGIARTQSRFPHSCVCELFIYIPRIVHIFPAAE
jgi:hypothetical protein